MVNELPLQRIDTAEADEGHPVGLQPGGEPPLEQGGHEAAVVPVVVLGHVGEVEADGHAVHVARLAVSHGVDVGVGVDPDQAGVLVLEGLMEPVDGADPDGVIAPDRQAELVLGQDLSHLAG